MKLTVSVALASGLVLFAGCGDDDDAESSTVTQATTDDTGSSTSTQATTDDAESSTNTQGTPDDTSAGDGEAAGGADDFCTSWIALIAGAPSPEMIREVAAVAPGDAGAALELIATGFEEQGEAYFDSPEFGESFAAVSRAANDECADDILEVVAIDYGYEGIPDEVAAGQIGVTLSNDGAELHELLILRRNDGVEQSFDELFELGEEEAGDLVTEVGGSFAAPGEESAALFDLTQPGDYVAVCFIPVGSTPDGPEEGGSGPPHFTQGMKVEFTVV